MDPGVEICQRFSILRTRAPQDQSIPQIDWQVICIDAVMIVMVISLSLPARHAKSITNPFKWQPG